MRCLGLLLLVLLLVAPGRIAAQPLAAYEIEIVEFGLYASRLDRTEKDANAPIGYFNWVSDFRLLEHGDEFCAKMNLEFGFEYRITGAAAGSPVVIDMVTRFPDAGMTNGVGKRFSKSEYRRQLGVGVAQFRTFKFEEPWEMVPGVWTFEFHHLGRKIGEKQFKILPSCPIS